MAKQLTDRWNVYSYLKQHNGQVSREDVNRRFTALLLIKPEEIREGIREYNDMARKSGAYQVMRERG